MRHVTWAISGLLAGAISAPPATLAAGTTPAALDEIVVTATRRETSLSETALAVSAFSADSIRDERIGDITDLSGAVPNVQINGRAQGAGNPISIRGVGSNVLGLGADDAVAVYVDGVYIGRAYGAVGELPGVERIEVLRGPQGTLYGRNATGGAISVISRPPGGDAALELDAGIGRLDERRLSVFATTPVSESLSVALAAAYRDRDGYSRNAYDGRRLNDASNWSVNGAIRYAPSGEFNATLRADAGRLRSSFQAKDIGAGDGDPDAFDVNFPGREVRRFSGVGLTLNRNLALATLTSITAFRSAGYDGTYDSDGTSADLYRLNPYYENQHQFSQELRLASTGEGALRWLGGAYFFDERALGSVQIPFYVFNSFVALTSANRTRSYAGFGEVSYAWTPRLTTTLGMRYSRDDKTFDFRQDAFGIFPTVAPSRQGRDASATTPRAVVEYRATPAMLVYASASRGFKSGGFSAINPLPAGAPRPFDPEHLWAYELGAKGETDDRRLRWSAAAFWYDYQDLQTRTSDQFGFVVIQNAGAAEIKGIEAEVTARPTGPSEFGGSLAYLDARYTEYLSVVPGYSAADVSGNVLNRAPKWSGSLWGQYEWALDDAGSVRVRAQYDYRTRIWYTEENLSPYGAGAVGEWKARVTYSPVGRSWSVAAFGENLSNRRYRTSVFDVGGRPQALFNLPRLYGVELHVAF